MWHLHPRLTSLITVRPRAGSAQHHPRPTLAARSSALTQLADHQAACLVPPERMPLPASMAGIESQHPRLDNTQPAPRPAPVPWGGATAAMSPHASPNAPFRHAGGIRECSFSYRHRHNAPEATVRPLRDETVAPRASPAGNAISRSLSVGSPRPDSRSPSARTSHSSYNPVDLNGFGTANRSRPPRSD